MTGFPPLDDARRPAVIAHRGASRAARENTVEAFHKARALRADAVEFDVRRTADGFAVVNHDAEVVDVGPIVDHAFDELREAAPWIPTLDEAVDAAAGMWINIEIKNLPTDPDFDPEEHLAGVVARLVRERGLHERAVVSCFYPITLVRVGEVDPDIATALLTVAAVDPFLGLDAAASGGHVAYHPELETSSGVDVDDLVARARDRDVAVVPWTVNEPDDIEALVRTGVAGVITDVPDVARRVIARAGRGGADQSTGTTSVSDSGS